MCGDTRLLDYHAATLRSADDDRSRRCRLRFDISATAFVPNIRIIGISRMCPST